jgi:hypothetical protein
MLGAYSASTYPMKVPVHKIQSCFTIYIAVFVNYSYIYHMGANAAVLMHIILITQISISYDKVKPTIFLQMSQT